MIMVCSYAWDKLPFVTTSVSLARPPCTQGLKRYWKQSNVSLAAISYLTEASVPSLVFPALSVLEYCCRQMKETDALILYLYAFAGRYTAEGDAGSEKARYTPPEA